MRVGCGSHVSAFLTSSLPVALVRDSLADMCSLSTLERILPALTENQVHQVILSAYRELEVSHARRVCSAFRRRCLQSSVIADQEPEDSGDSTGELEESVRRALDSMVGALERTLSRSHVAPLWAAFRRLW